MNQNPYEPPRAQLDPRRREPGSIPRAVIVGAVIDIGGTMLGGLVVGLCYSVLMSMQGHSADEIQRALSSFEPWSGLGILLTVIGVVMSGLGGYQCAVIANRPGYLAPGILSIVSTTFGAAMSDGEFQLSRLLFLSGVTVAAILIGASLHQRKLTAPAPRIPS